MEVAQACSSKSSCATCSLIALTPQSEEHVNRRGGEEAVSVGGGPGASGQEKYLAM